MIQIHEYLQSCKASLLPEKATKTLSKDDEGQKPLQIGLSVD
jgi:hypothetical protein